MIVLALVAGAGCTPAQSRGGAGPDPSTTTPPAPPTSSQAVPAPVFDHQPLWPFATSADAAAWQDRHRADGTDPWHLDPGDTAVAFSTRYLGFAEIDQVVAESVVGDEAWVDVGYRVEEGDRRPTAAVLHLARFGAGPDAPWEVVGTRDGDLSVTTPDYGAAVRSPFAVGGAVTGVDESLRVQVRQLASPAPIGERCCLPAGGTGTPWTTPVEFAGADGTALTVVVSTGGHVTDVERFAITGVRPD